MPDDDVRRITAEWLRYAREDLALAQTTLASRGAPRHVAYHSQQAAEKAIKALLVWAQIEFPFVHDLNRLRDMTPADSGLHSEFPQLGTLTRWAIRARYPLLDEPTEEEAVDAARLAQGVVQAVEKDLERRGVG